MSEHKVKEFDRITTQVKEQSDVMAQMVSDMLAGIDLNIGILAQKMGVPPESIVVMRMIYRGAVNEHLNESTTRKLAEAGKCMDDMMTELKEAVESVLEEDEDDLKARADMESERRGGKTDVH